MVIKAMSAVEPWAIDDERRGVPTRLVNSTTRSGTCALAKLSTPARGVDASAALVVPQSGPGRMARRGAGDVRA